MNHVNNLSSLIQMALREDVGKGDLTAMAVPTATKAVAKIVAKEACVVSGVELAQMVLKEFGSSAHCVDFVTDGFALEKGNVLGIIKGNAREILTCERTILNFLQRLCGIATNASSYKELIGNSKVILLDTRKTTPGFRSLEKKAVRDGGLTNHRSRLDEAVLLKENHLRAAGSITKAIENLKANLSPEKFTSIPVQVEVTCWNEIQEAMDCGLMRMLLDNFSPEETRKVVSRIRESSKEIYLEASGGITKENIAAYAATGVNAISMGALTHSVKSTDLSLLFDFHV